HRELAAVRDEELPDRHGGTVGPRRRPPRGLVLLHAADGVDHPDVSGELQRLLLRLLRPRHGVQCSARAARNRVTSRINAAKPPQAIARPPSVAERERTSPRTFLCTYSESNERSKASSSTLAATA